MRLLKGGKLPPERLPAVIEMVSKRGDVSDLTFLFEQLNVNGTADLVDRFVQAPMQHHAALDKVLVRAVDDADAGE